MQTRMVVVRITLENFRWLWGVHPIVWPEPTGGRLEEFPSARNDPLPKQILDDFIVPDFVNCKATPAVDTAVRFALHHS